MSTRRATCRSCGAEGLETFLRLGDLPLSDGLRFEEDLEKPETRFPLEVAFCPRCSLVQILETVPAEVLFGEDYPYFSSFSEALLAHSKTNVDARLAERDLGGESLVVELASNDGYLLQYYAREGVPVLGIDPAPGPARAAREKGIPTLERFFTREVADELVAGGRRADVIHGNNVLAHVTDTNGFVAGIRSLIKEDGLVVIEAPYLLDLIDGCEFDTIYHEHLCYFSVTALDRLFRRHGLFLNRVEHLDIHGGSLRLFVEPVERVEDSVGEYLRREEAVGSTKIEYYRDFSERVDRVRSDLRSLLGELKGKGARIGGYGAAAKGAILLNCAGVGRETIDWVADLNVHKQGRFMPGVHLPIVDPVRLLEEQPDYVLILPWNFADEIVSQQREYLARGGRFIVPIPTPRIL
jgi:SAM-dependent methyltransferase